MDKLKKLESLGKTKEMWLWISEHGTSNKADYFNHFRINEENRPKHYCYCCEYAIQQYTTRTSGVYKEYMHNDICKYCPLLKYWSGAKDFSINKDSDNVLCQYSEFGDWTDAYDSKYAKIISDISERAINDLKNKRSKVK